MKARIPERRKLSNETKKIIEEYVKQSQNDAARHFLMLSCAILNDKFGFGKSRLESFMAEFMELEKDEILWWHIEKKMDQIGLDFKREGDEG